MNMYKRVKLIEVPEAIRTSDIKLYEDYLNLKISEACDELSKETGGFRVGGQMFAPELDEISPGILFRVTALSSLHHNISNVRRNEIEQKIKGHSKSEVPRVDGASKKK